MKNLSRKKRRNYRHLRVRKKIKGISAVPRVSVFKSSRHVYAQIIDDSNGSTIVSASTLTPGIINKISTEKYTKTDRSKIVGEYLGEIAITKGIKKVRFDRGGYPYHGRIKALAEGLREKGLEF